MPPKPKAPVKPTAVGKVKKKTLSHKLAPHINEGKIIVDLAKKSWRIGKSIGRGGFGEIYTASDDPSKPPSSDAPYVVKIEPKSNGPLFTERAFYMAGAKQETIDDWKQKRHLKFLGMPPYVASGGCEHSGEELRFLVMHRYGTDVHKLFEQNKRKMPFKTVMNLGIKIMDILEYIHAQGYVHADIKGSNLLLGIKKGEENEVYLVDYGLATKYIKDGVMRRTEKDSRFAHNGTIEFASRDAHLGISSRRSDLEILGYNLLQWLAGTLPWEEKALTEEGKGPLSDEQVAASKEHYMKHIPSLVSRIPDALPKGPIRKYLEYVASLPLEAEPDYEKCRQIFRDGLREAGLPEDGKLEFSGTTKLKKVATSLESENLPVKKRPAVRGSKTGRKPCAPKNVKTPSGSDSFLSDADDEVFAAPSARKKKKILESSVDLSDSSSSKASSYVGSPNSGQPGIPTPAMLAVQEAIRKRMENEGEVKVKKKKKSSSSSVDCSVSDPSQIMTPAMLEVLKRREEKAKGRGKGQSKVAAKALDDALPDLEVNEILVNRRRSQGPVRRPPTKVGRKKVISSKISPIVKGKKSPKSPLASTVARSSPRFRTCIATQTSPGIYATPRITRTRNYRIFSSTLNSSASRTFNTDNSPDIF